MQTTRRTGFVGTAGWRICKAMLLGVVIIATVIPGSVVAFSQSTTGSPAPLFTAMASGRIVFDSDPEEAGYYQIYTMNSDGSHMIRIATPMRAEGPAFSPDGRRIVFVSFTSPQEAEIYIMGVDGSHLSRLVTLPGMVLLSLAFSPDGRRIAFGAALGGPSQPSWWQPAQIYIMNVDGSHLTRLTNLQGESLTPAFSPDGRRIAFTHRNPPAQLSQIYIMDADGSHLNRLTNLPGGSAFPTFSPDGRIAFVSTPGIYTMNSDGSHLTRLPAPDGMALGIASPRFSPDGNKIAFSYFDYRESTPTPSWQIYIIDTDGSHLTRLTGLDHPAKNDRGRAQNIAFGP